MKIRADLHNHVHKNFNKVIDKTEKTLGRGGIIGLVNYEDSRYELFAIEPGYERENLGNSLYIPEKDILILKGQEVPTKQGEILVFGMCENKHLTAGKTLEDTLKQAKDNNGIIIVPHPFLIYSIGNSLKKNLYLLEYFDGFELHNSQASLFNLNKKAKKFYNKEIKKIYHVGAVSSSDSKLLYEIGTSYILLEKPNLENSEKLLETLKNSIKEHQDYSLDKQQTSIFGALIHLPEAILERVLRKINLTQTN